MILLVCSRERCSSLLAYFTSVAQAECVPISKISSKKVAFDEGTGGVILTSALAVSAIPETNLPIYCVGKKTAQAAQQKGLGVQFVGKGNAQQMAKKLVSRNLPKKLAHVAGDVARKNWYSIFTEKGTSVHSLIGYSTKYVSNFSSTTVEKIRAGKFQYILFFSKNGAMTFMKVCRQNKFDLGHTKAVAISNAAAKPLHGFEEISVACKPSREEVKNTLKKLVFPDIK